MKKNIINKNIIKPIDRKKDSQMILLAGITISILVILLASTSAYISNINATFSFDRGVNALDEYLNVKEVFIKVFNKSCNGGNDTNYIQNVFNNTRNTLSKIEIRYGNYFNAKLIRIENYKTNFLNAVVNLKLICKNTVIEERIEIPIWVYNDIEIVDPTGEEILNINQNEFDNSFAICNKTDGDWGAAQNFSPTISNITKVELYIRNFNSSEFDLVVELRKDHPKEGDLIDTVTFTPAEVSENFEWLEVDFDDVVVDAGVDYFIVVPPAPGDITGDFGYEWCYSEENRYEDGWLFFTKNGGDTWSAISEWDFAFRIYGLI